MKTGRIEIVLYDGRIIYAHGTVQETERHLVFTPNESLEQIAKDFRISTKDIARTLLCIDLEPQDSGASE